jgi:hypothetical protein
MDSVDKNKFATDLEKLQRIMGKAPLDYIISNDHLEFLEELAECAAEVAQKASMLSSAIRNKPPQGAPILYRVEDGSGGGTYSVRISAKSQEEIDRLIANWEAR